MIQLTESALAAAIAVARVGNKIGDISYAIGTTLRVDPDGWILRSANGDRTAHSEHAIAITAAESVVLTAREIEYPR